MNIRSVSALTYLLAKEKISDSKPIKSSDAEDREAQGESGFSSENFHRSLNEEEMQQVLEKISSNEGILMSGLSVEHIVKNKKNFVYIKTPEGQVVRKIGDRELFSYLLEEDGDSFHLVQKSA